MSQPEPDDNTPKGRARRETLAIPQSVRDIIDERDQLYCRVCGRFQGERRAHHHINFGGDRQGMGGRRDHDPAGIITVCWMWAGNCHDLVHSDKHRWQQLLLDTAQRGGITALQLDRWRRKGR